MTRRYPRIRLSHQDGRQLLREGLILCFFIRHPHSEIAPAVSRALDFFVDAVGSEKLGWFLDRQTGRDPEEYKHDEVGMRPLNEQGWATVRNELRDPISCILQLEEHEAQVGGFHFEYYGRQRSTLDDPTRPDVVSAVSFWLPTEYLEENGPARVRELAVAMARELPFHSGYVSLAFNYLDRFKEVLRVVHEHCFRYPGMDVHDLEQAASELGTKARGAYWLNFYGQPLLGQLGGMETLRQRLDLPDISIEPLDGEKLLVALGEWPETGDVGQQHPMRLYRALARTLEPHLDEELPRRWFGFSREQLRRWQRRFLD
jgi:hypothetical protein